MNIINDNTATEAAIVTGSGSTATAGVSRSARHTAKPAIAFLERNTDAILAIAIGTILQSLDGNPLYPAPIPSLATLTAAHDRYVAAINAAKDRGKASIAQRNQARGLVVQEVRELALYVQRLCEGDPVKLISSGFTAQRNRHRPIGTLDAPAEVRLVLGRQKGQLIARCKPCAHALTYEWRYASAAAIAAASTTASAAGATPAPIAWIEPDGVSKSSLVLEGLTAGTVYTAQVRVLGTSGPSDWSDTTTAMSMQVSAEHFNVKPR